MLIEMLRKKIRECRKSLNQLSRETGIDVAALCRIVNGGDCKTATADKICKYFKLKIIGGNKMARHKDDQATYRGLANYKERVQSFNMAVNKIVEYTRVQLEMDTSQKRSNRGIVEARKKTIRKAIDRINQLAEQE